MSADHAVCYTTDINFLLPSLVSAMGVRRFVAPDKARIYIFLVDADEDALRELNVFLQPHAIEILPLDSRFYTKDDISGFKKSHVPPAALGRFFLCDVLPDSVKHIVYLDGDTWIVRDPSALVEAVVPEGHMAAAEDAIYLRQRGNVGTVGRDIRQYFKTLGLSDHQGYMNSGVFAVSRQSWKVLAAEAYDFLLKNMEISAHHDQSALNAVMGDRRLRLSSRWNFQTPYRYMGVEDTVKPCIYHFTQSPKPWMGAALPWAEIYPDYMKAIAPFAGFDLPLKTVEPQVIEDHNRFIQKKFRVLTMPFVKDVLALMTGVYGLEKRAWL